MARTNPPKHGPGALGPTHKTIRSQVLEIIGGIIVWTVVATTISGLIMCIVLLVAYESL